MSEFFTELIKLVSDPSPKKFGGMIFLVALVGGIAWVADRQMSFLVLHKLERSQRLLDQIATNERNGTLDSETKELQRRIKAEVGGVLATLRADPSAAVSSVQKDRLGAFITGATPWLLLTVLAAAGPKRPEITAGTSIGLMVFAAGAVC